LGDEELVRVGNMVAEGLACPLADEIEHEVADVRVALITDVLFLIKMRRGG